MALPGSASVFTPRDCDARLALYAAVLEAEGFTLDSKRPYTQVGVSGEWESPEGWNYKVSLSVAGERPMLGSLACITTKRVQWLFACMQLDEPADLVRLLHQCVSLADAKHRAGYPAPAPRKFVTSSQ
jgi:hypothetical protein